MAPVLSKEDRQASECLCVCGPLAHLLQLLSEQVTNRIRSNRLDLRRGLEATLTGRFPRLRELVEGFCPTTETVDEYRAYHEQWGIPAPDSDAVLEAFRHLRLSVATMARYLFEMRYLGLPLKSPKKQAGITPYLFNSGAIILKHLTRLQVGCFPLNLAAHFLHHHFRLSLIVPMGLDGVACLDCTNSATGWCCCSPTCDRERERRSCHCAHKRACQDDRQEPSQVNFK